MRKRLTVEHDVHPPSSIFTKPQISKGFSCESSTLENCLISVVTCYDPLHTVWKEIIGNDAKLKRFRWIMYSKLSPSIFNEKNHANVTFFYAVDVDDMSEAFFFCRWKLFWGIRIRTCEWRFASHDGSLHFIIPSSRPIDLLPLIDARDSRSVQRI